MMPTALLPVSLAQALPPLGPLDGAGLPPTEVDRVRVGMVAPDFRLADTTGPSINCPGIVARRMSCSSSIAGTGEGAVPLSWAS